MMAEKQWFTEGALAAIAKRFREQAQKSRAQAARDMGVSQTSIFNAEESPEQSLAKLRIRMIEAYSNFTVEGAFFRLKRKQAKGGLPKDAIGAKSARRT